MPHTNNHQDSSSKMLSFAPHPVAAPSWNHRPNVSSPLSSSPIRASMPLSPVDRNTLFQRQTQSSPIQPPKFKFATRNVRPNPLVRRREETQEKRRHNFLQNVREKSEDKAWKRRDVEGQFLKQSLLTGMGQLTFDAPTFSESDIEDAMAYQQETVQLNQGDDQEMENPPDEEEELEAMFASYEDRQATPSAQPRWSPTPSLASFDEEYDDLFAELIASERSPQQQPHFSQASPLFGHAESMDEDSNMSL